jgi:threonine synthase
LGAFRQSGRFELDAARDSEALALFGGARLDDQGTLAEIARLQRDTGELVDPHSAVGVYAGRRLRRDPAVPLVALATAHPAKFPDAVAEASGIRPALPPRLADLYDREERYVVHPHDLAAVQGEIRGTRARVDRGAA